MIHPKKIATFNLTLTNFENITRINEMYKDVVSKSFVVNRIFENAFGLGDDHIHHLIKNFKISQIRDNAISKCNDKVEHLEESLRPVARLIS